MPRYHHQGRCMHSSAPDQNANARSAFLHSLDNIALPLGNFSLKAVVRHVAHMPCKEGGIFWVKLIAQLRFRLLDMPHALAWRRHGLQPFATSAFGPWFSTSPCPDSADIHQGLLGCRCPYSVGCTTPPGRVRCTWDGEDEE